MIYFPFLLLATSGLLARTTFAVLLPGQVVHVAADQTIGAHHGGAGAHIAHPNIVLGTEKGTGNVILAPVTHAPDEKNGPFMGHADKLHPKLEGNVLLHHVTANPANIPNQPSFNGAYANPGALDQIEQAKMQAAEQVHKDAKVAHHKAAKAHEKAATAHDTAADKFAKFGNSANAVKEHRDKATEHRDLAKDHGDTEQSHRQQAKDHHDDAMHNGELSKPLTFTDYTAAQASQTAATQSRYSADNSKDHAKATTEHLKAALTNFKASSMASGRRQKELETTGYGHIAKAEKHAPSSNAKPNAADSIDAAKDSRHTAQGLVKSMEKAAKKEAKNSKKIKKRSLLKFSL